MPRKKLYDIELLNRVVTGTLLSAPLRAEYNVTFLKTQKEKISYIDSLVLISSILRPHFKKIRVVFTC